MAKSQIIQNPPLSELELYGLLIRKLTTMGRACLENEKEVPEKIWAEIDRRMDELLRILPNR